MVTIDFGDFGGIDMRDMASVWEDVFGPSFADDFDGRNTPLSIRYATHDIYQYQLDTRDGVNGLGPGSGAAVWFYGRNFDYNGLGEPRGGTAEEIQVYSAADVNRHYDTYRVIIHGLDSPLPSAVDIVESKNLDPFLEGERLTILGHRSNDFLVGNGRADELYGFSGRDTLHGGKGDDFLDGGADADRLLGEGGMDTLVWQASDIKVDGGTGFDTMKLWVDLNLTNVSNSRIVNVERIDMTGGGGDVLTLRQADVLAMSSNDVLRVAGDFGDVVHRGTGWSGGAIVDGFHTYTRGLATLLVDSDIISVV